MRARARLNDKLDPRVVVGEHGWWQDCEELGVTGYDSFTPQGANFNRTVDSAPSASVHPCQGAYVLFFGAFGTAWDDAMVARWSANLPSAVRRPVVILAAG
jgi:hypothetical protein